jgi:hypothetical protein
MPVASTQAVTFGANLFQGPPGMNPFGIGNGATPQIPTTSETTTKLGDKEKLQELRELVKALQ